MLEVAIFRSPPQLLGVCFWREGIEVAFGPERRGWKGGCWKFLTIVSKSKGQKEDDRGKVEFIADYFWDGEVQQLHQHSRFRRFKGNWKYYDDKG